MKKSSIHCLSFTSIKFTLSHVWNNVWNNLLRMPPNWKIQILKKCKKSLRNEFASTHTLSLISFCCSSNCWSVSKMVPRSTWAGCQDASWKVTNSHSSHENLHISPINSATSSICVKYKQQHYKVLSHTIYMYIYINSHCI